MTVFSVGVLVRPWLEPGTVEQKASAVTVALTKSEFRKAANSIASLI